MTPIQGSLAEHIKELHEAKLGFARGYPESGQTVRDRCDRAVLDINREFRDALDLMVDLGILEELGFIVPAPLDR